jgi:hypothetical protein
VRQAEVQGAARGQAQAAHRQRRAARACGEGGAVLDLYRTGQGAAAAQASAGGDRDRGAVEAAVDRRRPALTLVAPVRPLLPVSSSSPVPALVRLPLPGEVAGVAAVGVLLERSAPRC